MGLCCSAPQVVPCCARCGMLGSGPWDTLSDSEKDLFVWRSGRVMCRRCLALWEAVQDRPSQGWERDWQAMARAKQREFPLPTEGLKPMRPLPEGSEWANTRSFRAPCRAPSALDRLVSAIRRAQAADPQSHVGVQRKASGFVPAPRQGVPAQPVAHAAPAPRQQGSTPFEPHLETPFEPHLEEPSSAAQLRELEELHAVQPVEERSIHASPPLSASFAAFADEDATAAVAAAGTADSMPASSSCVKRLGAQPAEPASQRPRAGRGQRLLQMGPPGDASWAPGTP
ncbi:hypothetical protein ABPG75_001487 [Micractinium tetrahymenae]